MRFFRRFVIFLIPIAALCFMVSILYKWNYVQHEQKLPGEFNVPTKSTGFDADRDNVDDLKDVYKNVEEYISMNPKYEWREYAGGYPDDGFGVAIDLVNYGLRGAGYDMQNLIWMDIEKNPEAYPENHGEKNVAFRKVENSRIFMSRYFTRLSNDMYGNKADWQAGDIIFFEKNHVAVVADKLNKNGIRFIIHHFWGFQAGYFQDVLETGAWGKIIGHYRVAKNALSPVTNGGNK